LWFWSTPDDANTDVLAEVRYDARRWGDASRLLRGPDLPPLQSCVLLPVPPDPRPMILLTICLMAAALVGFALLLFQRRD